MRITLTIATALTLALLTWLWLQGMNAGMTTTDDARGALDEIAIAESTLHRDVLSARVGILRNYDPLVREINALRKSADRLSADATGDAEFSSAVGRLMEMITEQERWTEEFKTDNALLRNSSAYFEISSARVAAADHAQMLARQVSDLATALLHLTLDTSLASESDVDERLAKLSVLNPPSLHSAMVAALLAHARMLRKMLPATDATVKILFAVPDQQQERTIREMVESRRIAAKRKAEVFRYNLYGVSLLLVGSLVCLAIRLQSRALTLHRLERDRERLQESLQTARQMETIGAFASGIAHNFNNIIGAILGFAESAQAYLLPGTRPGENLAEIRRAAERARDLIHQILTFGRRRDSRRDRICVNALVAETKALLDASLSPHVNVVIDSTLRNAIVIGELAQLQQVVLNVCNNAAQAMEAPGSIQITVDVHDLKVHRHTPHGDLSPGRYAVISVADPGRGMDELTLERIFEPFFSTRVGGNGLGLATVREIVLRHAGAVMVCSAPGAGARFDIWLPCVPNGETAVVLGKHDSSGRGAGQTVLVVSADRERLLQHEEILAALGYEPVGFTQANEAVAACRAAPDRFDVALMCCHPPMGTRWRKDAAALRESAPNMPLILATASARELGAPSLADAGISEIIRQPLTSTELAGALANCLLRK